MSDTKAGGLALIGFAILGIAWTGLELSVVASGLTDGDDPAVTMAFLRAHPDAYVAAGSALIAMSVALTVSVLAVSDAFASVANRLALRSLTVLALFSAFAFLLLGTLRLTTGPLLYIDGLQAEWGETAALVIQVVGVHGLGQAAILTLCLWAVGISVIGYRTRAIPVVVCLLGIFPLIRIIGLLGPLGILPEDMPDILWIVFTLAIPGALLWCLALGIALLRRPAPAAAAAAPAA